MSRPRLLQSIPSLLSRQCRRGEHTVPELRNFEHLSSNGMANFMTPVGVETAWTVYQDYLVKMLSKLTAGNSADYTASTRALIIKYARQPSNATVFNYASQAFNNHFYFKCLHPTELNIPIPDGLKSNLEVSFGSIETLKQDFLATANSMFGPGYVWLVKSANTNRFSLLNTYIAGTPFAEAHWRQQPADLNTSNATKSVGEEARRRAMEEAPPTNAVGLVGRGSEAERKGPGGVRVVPVLCVSTWQHAYITDWGSDGKREFLKAWWDRIDWQVVADHAHISSSPLGR